MEVRRHTVTVLCALKTLTARARGKTPRSARAAAIIAHGLVAG